MRLRQGLIGCADKHQVIEELTIRLGEAGTSFCTKVYLGCVQRLIK